MQSIVNNYSGPNRNLNGNKAKHWTFTVINPNDAHISKFEDIKKFTTYWIYGKEICPSTGTPHLQCYLAGIKQITRPTMCKWFGTDNGNTYAVSLGTPEENKIYCSKDGKFTEWGILPEDGRKKGGEATKQKWSNIIVLSKKRDFKTLEEDHPKEFMVNYKNIKQIGFDFSITPVDLDSPCGEWIWGPTGVGKSRTARQENPGAYIKGMNKWWDNYEGQDVVIIEDMSPSFGASMEYFMKIWPDAYSFPAEIKNHTVRLRPKKIVVTSQYHPRDIWYKEAYDAIVRRFKFKYIPEFPKKDNLVSLKSTTVVKPKVKSHDKPYMKEKVIKKVKQPKLVEEKAEKVEPKPFVLTYEQAKTMFTPVPKEWDKKIHIENDAQDIDDLIDCAEIDAIHALQASQQADIDISSCSYSSETEYSDEDSSSSSSY